MDITNEIRNNYLFIKLTGQFDINRIKENIIEAGEMLRRHNLKKKFLDMTEVSGFDENHLLVMESFDFYSLISKSHPLGTKTSLLGTEKMIRIHKVYEDVLVNRGFPTKVTTSREEGLKFLGVLSEEKS